MNWYRRHLYPALVDLIMSGDSFSRLREHVVRPLSGEILEIGFGTGLNARFYASSVPPVTAIDPNTGMSSRAERRIRDASAAIHRFGADAAALPFPSESFDTVVTTWTLCSIGPVRTALAEIRRVLRPGGHYAFVEHGASPDPHIRRWQDRLTPFQRRIADGCHLNREIEALVREAGFPAVAIERFYVESLPKVAGYTYTGWAGTDSGEIRPPDAMIR